MVSKRQNMKHTAWGETLREDIKTDDMMKNINTQNNKRMGNSFKHSWSKSD